MAFSFWLIDISAIWNKGFSSESMAKLIKNIQKHYVEDFDFFRMDIFEILNRLFPFLYEKGCKVSFKILPIFNCRLKGMWTTYKKALMFNNKL